MHRFVGLEGYLAVVLDLKYIENYFGNIPLGQVVS
jgi:hypothetical protein